MTDFFPSALNSYPVSAPYHAAIPNSLLQGDSGEWIDIPFTDVNGVTYDSVSFTLKYTFAGPTLPLVLTATQQNGSSSWQTNITPTQSGALTAGKYWWTAQIFGAGVRITLAKGEIEIEADLSLAAAGFDNRTFNEKALAAAEAALGSFGASGGVKLYTIGTRHMEFSRDMLIAEVNYWRNRVHADNIKAKGARSRIIGVRFQSAR